MKIVIFNVKYSENLGDGLLAQCLEKALSTDDVEVETIDLAGRTNFGTQSGHRRQALQILQMLPPFARRLAVRFALRAKMKELSTEWRKRIDRADAIVLGGGNLFQDDDLNFPLKVGTLIKCAGNSGKPLAIYAVGVSEAWSAAASKLFKQIQTTKLIHISVRDDRAAENWRNHFPAGPIPAVVPDPGLLARDMAAVACNSTSKSNRRTVGLCVTDPVILRRHAGTQAANIPLIARHEYVALIGQLARSEYHVLLFTNGAREDQAFAKRIFDSRELDQLRASKTLELAERPQTPQDLIRILPSMSVMLAHRLHACIAAYSCGTPHVGLGWDQKVKSFFLAVGREAHLVEGSNIKAEHLSALIKEAEEIKIDNERRYAVLEAASDAIQDMRESLLPFTQVEVQSR